MATDVFIYSKQRLHEPRGGLEDDLDDLLSGAGEVTGGGGGEAGWNIDVQLRDAADVESWVSRLRVYLQEWGVPGDTYFVIDPEGSEPWRVEVFADHDRHA